MMLQVHPFSTISIELKTVFRRATRGLDEIAVARRTSTVFEDSLPGSVFLIVDAKYVDVKKS